MKHVTLKKIAKFINGRAFKPSEWEEDGLPIIRIQNLTGSSKKFNFFSGDFDDRYRVMKGDILISWSASLGVYEWKGDDAILNQHIFRVEVDKSCVDKKYFYYAATNVLDDMKSEVHGATMQHITKDRFQALTIPLPALPEQKRIAGILTQADRCRQMRRYALTLTDNYLQSVFLQMFGDPITNPMGWETKPLDHLLGVIESGWSPVCKDRSANDNEWGFLKLGAVTTCNFIENENKAITSNTLPREELEVQAGDILFSRKNTYTLVGACAYIYKTRSRLMLSDLIFRLNIKEKDQLLPIFLWQMLVFPTMRKQVQGLARGAAGSMPNISKTRLRTIQIPVPPISLQEKFTDIAQKFEQTKAQQKEAVRQANHLFDTLLHRAFVDN